MMMMMMMMMMSFICSCRNKKYERLLELRRDSQDATTEDTDYGEQKCGREVGRDEAESYEEVIFGRRRPQSVVVDWTNNVLFVLEFMF
jgi:hypothetical protein